MTDTWREWNWIFVPRPDLGIVDCYDKDHWPNTAALLESWDLA